jgi:ketosteroid isomerase-like protein
MSQENVEIVRRGYELFAAGDLQGVAALFAADSEFADAGGLGVSDAAELGMSGTAVGTRQGPEGFLRGIKDVLEAFEDYHVEAEEFIEAGDAVAVPVRITGRGRASGADQEARLVHLWVLRNGKVIRGTVHRTTAEALEAAGSAAE